MKKIFSLLAAVLFAGSMMADNFALVTSVSDLADGDQIIITNKDADRAISTTQNNNNRGVAQVTATNDVIVPDETVQIITLVADGSNFMLQVGEDAYLYAASNSSNHLKTAGATTVGDNGKFAITIAADSIASVIAQGANQRNDLRYNTSGLFSCYASNTSTEAGLKIFKKQGGVTPPAAVAKPVISGEASFFDSTAVTLTCATEGAVLFYTLDGSEPDDNATEYKAPFVLKETATVKAIAFEQNGGQYSAVASKTFTKNPSFASFEALVAAKLADKTVVEVAFADVLVDSIYANGQGVRKGIYINVLDSTGKKPVEIYYSNGNVAVPAEWAAGDTLSGNIRGNWTVYNGQWEIVPTTANWTWAELTRKAAADVPVLPDPTNCAEAREAALSVSANNELYNGGKEYTIEGYVTAIQTAYSEANKNITFWMADSVDGGNVLEAYRAACDSAEAAPGVGDKVAVTGKLTKYNSTPEFAQGCTFVITEKSAPAVNLGEKTIAEFLELKNTKDTCILTGVVDSIANTTYGNLYLSDTTARLYIYGVLTPAGESKKFAELDVEKGDTLTVKAIYTEYQGSPQASNAIFVEVKKAPSQGIEDVDAAVKATKRIINGQIIIEKNGKTYSIMGQEIR